MESMALGRCVYQFLSLCGHKVVKYREEMSKTFVCRFPKLAKCVVTWFLFGTIQ